MLKSILNQHGRRALLPMMLGAFLFTGGSALAQPANDNCDTATVVPSSAPTPAFTDLVDTTTATLDPNDPLMSCNFPGLGDGDNTVWYEWTPDTSGLVNITTAGSTLPDGSDALDTVHAMYTGACGALVEVACVDFGLTDELIVEVEAGTTYRIKVGEFAGGVTQDPFNGGNLVFSVEPPPEPEQVILESVRNGVSPPIRDIVGPGAATLGAEDAAALAETIREVANITIDEVVNVPLDATSPGSLVAGEKSNFRGLPKMLQSFEGGENLDNALTFGFFIAPPDTIGDVGRTHYVQMFNLLTEIFDKDGTSVLGPFPTSVFFTGLGGVCEFENLGDPIVIYDEETDRWLVSQFQGFGGFPGFQLCVAMSTSGDPTGTWNQYEFDFAGIGFPDYPKYGFATDSINVMANLFVPFQGATLGAIDKAEVMAGDPATMVLFIPKPFEFGFVPGDNDGPVFHNTKPTFFGNTFFGGNTIDVWEMTPDWDTPENSTIGEVASIGVTPYDTGLCTAPRGACVPQPGSGTGDFPFNVTFLEGITDRMMHRGQTRDFGNDKIAMLNHTVDADGTGKAGVRWYELRNHKDRGWTLKKENTFSPDSDYRWMGSIAMTASGETCLGYSISSFDTYPSIGVAGRKGTANHLNVPELVVFDGNATGNVQRQVARWGDYSSMNIDPVDDTCWYTQEYARPWTAPPLGERFGWGTRIIQFQLPGNGKNK